MRTSRRPPDPFVFFIDRSLEGAAVVAAVRSSLEVGEKLECHRDHVEHDERDDVWIPAVAKKGWIVLAKDKMVIRRTNEIAAVVTAKALYFCLSRGNHTGPEQAEAIRLGLPQIRTAVRGQRPAVVGRTGFDGRVTVQWAKGKRLPSERELRPHGVPRR